MNVNERGSTHQDKDRAREVQTDDSHVPPNEQAGGLDVGTPIGDRRDDTSLFGQAKKKSTFRFGESPMGRDFNEGLTQGEKSFTQRGTGDNPPLRGPVVNPDTASQPRLRLGGQSVSRSSAQTEHASEQHDATEVAGAIPIPNETTDAITDVATAIEATESLAAEVQKFDQVYESGEPAHAKAAQAAELLASFENRLDSIWNHLAASDSKNEELAAEVLRLRRLVADLSQETRPIPRTIFDSLGRAILRTSVAVAVGGLLGGPAIAYCLGEPFHSKFVEGMIGGGAGSVANEIAQWLDPNRPSP